MGSKVDKNPLSHTAFIIFFTNFTYSSIMFSGCLIDFPCGLSVTELVVSVQDLPPPGTDHESSQSSWSKRGGKTWRIWKKKKPETRTTENQHSNDGVETYYFDISFYATCSFLSWSVWTQSFFHSDLRAGRLKRSTE